MTGSRAEFAASHRHPLWWLPNALTLARIALAPVIVVFAGLAVGAHSIEHAGPARSVWTAAAGVLVAISGIFDGLDGALARRWGVESRFGRVWDPIADKVSTGAGVIAASMIAPLLWPAAMVMIGRDLAVSVLRARTGQAAGALAPSSAAKAKTALTFAGLVMVLAFVPIGALVQTLLGPSEWGVAAAMISFYAGHAALYAAAVLSARTGLAYAQIAKTGAITPPPRPAADR